MRTPSWKRYGLLVLLALVSGCNSKQRTAHKPKVREDQQIASDAKNRSNLRSANTDQTRKTTGRIDPSPTRNPPNQKPIKKPEETIPEEPTRYTKVIWSKNKADIGKVTPYHGETNLDPLTTKTYQVIMGEKHHFDMPQGEEWPEPPSEFHPLNKWTELEVRKLQEVD